MTDYSTLYLEDSYQADSPYHFSEYAGKYYGRTVELRVCQKCSAVIVDESVHDDFHDELDGFYVGNDLREHYARIAEGGQEVAPPV